MLNEINIQMLDFLNEKQLININNLEDILEKMKSVLNCLTYNSTPFNSLSAVISEFEKQKDDLLVQHRKLNEIIDIYGQCRNLQFVNPCSEDYSISSYRIWSEYSVNLPDENDFSLQQLALNEQWLISKVFEFLKK